MRYKCYTMGTNKMVYPFKTRFISFKCLSLDVIKLTLNGDKREIVDPIIVRRNKRWN